MKHINKAINHNEGKPRPEIKVSELGAKEYGRDNWKAGGEEFLADNLDSILRHILAYSQGQVIDPKSGCHHLAHVRRRCAIALEHWARPLQSEKPL
jgi:hypothetical protein